MNAILTKLSMFVLGLFSIVQAVHAADESYITSLDGTINSGSPALSNIDPKFRDLPLSEWNQIHNISVDNIITFELRNDVPVFYYNQSFVCTLKVSIEYRSSRDQQNPTVINDVDLVVKYNKDLGTSYPVEAQYKFINGYDVTVKVTSITSPELGTNVPAIFRLKNQIFIKRKYPFQNSVSATVVVADDSDSDDGNMILTGSKLIVSWNPADFPGAEEFDVEWTYVDRQGSKGNFFNNPGTITDAQVEEIMKNDNSRVTVSGASYKMEIPYTDGFVLVRVRGVAYQLNTNLRLTTNWIFRDGPTLAFSEIDEGHQPNLNWQYTGSFAEEGKRKDVISYFDGTLRSRQVVTLSSSDDKTVAAETIYDEMGRPALNILPAPLDNNKLQYYIGLSKNLTEQPYSHIDITSGNDALCNIMASKLSGDGAAKYYSPQNPFISNSNFYFSKYVPDADGYPFSLTEYMPDNTGRIRRQGGVGKVFQIGVAEHETNYFYGKPMPRELYRLFGMEVGNASHYLKNMVIDANGQASISYVDAKGRTIATALAGGSPSNLEELASAEASIAKKSMNQVLIGSGDFEISAGNYYKKATATFLVAHPGLFKINYSVNPSALGPFTDRATDQAFCINCYYEVMVTVKNDCGEVIDSKSSIPFTGNDIACHTPAAEFMDVLEVQLERRGEYTVAYTLTLSNDIVNTQVNEYITRNKALKQLKDFFNEERLQADLSDCYSECSTCQEKLGTAQEFETNMWSLLLKLQSEKYSQFVNQFDINEEPFKTTILNWIQAKYTELSQNCASIAADCLPASPCDQKLELMKYDVRPGGQYALYVGESAPYTLFDDGTNVLLLYNSGISGIDNLNFEDESGNIVHIKETVNGQPVYISVSTFIEEYFKHPEWADEFVKLHPEYCSYEWCKDQVIPNQPASQYINEESYRFDAMLRENISSGQQAVERGYFGQLNSLLLADPFFNGGRGTGIYKTAMQSDLENLSDVLKMTAKDANGNYMAKKNILQLIDWMLYNRPLTLNPTPTEVSNSWTAPSPAEGCRSLTREWELYRNYYLQLKSKYMELIKMALVPECSNCYIGSDRISGDCEVNSGSTHNTCPVASDFHIEPILIEDNSTYSGSMDYADHSHAIYYVHTAGPVTAPVVINVTMEETFLVTKVDDLCGSVLQSTPPTTIQMTLNPGEDRVLLGITSWRYGQNLQTNCYTYFDNVTQYSATPVICSINTCTQICTGDQSTVYGNMGTVIYQPGYNSDGSGTPDGDILTNSFWKATCGNSTCGPLNRTSIWPCNSGLEEDQWIQVDRNVSFPVSKTYYFGVSGDNYVRLSIDGNTIVSTTSDVTYNYWHIFPVFIEAGTHQVSIAGYDNEALNGFGCEIYDNTVAQIRAATSLADLTVLFTTSGLNGTLGFCPGNPTSSCPSDPRYDSYKDKIRVWDDYVNIQGYLDCRSANGLPITDIEAETQLRNEANANLAALKDSWKQRMISFVQEENEADLQNGVTQRFADLASIYDSEGELVTLNSLLNTLLDNLEMVSMKFIDIAPLDKIRIVSTLPKAGDPGLKPGDPVFSTDITASNGYNNFKQVFTAIIGTNLMNKGFGPDLLDQPFPYDKQPVMVNSNSGEINADICGRVTTLRNLFGQGTVSEFHVWLKSQLEEDYTLSEQDLEDLLNRCTSGCRLLKEPVILPVAFTAPAGSAVWTGCATVSALEADYEVEYPQVAVGTKLHRVLLTNFLNHRLGYSLLYDEYLAFQNRCDQNSSALLFNKPGSPHFQEDNFACVAGIMSGVFERAGLAYEYYIDMERKRFRNELVSKCLSTQAIAKLEGDQYEYHYTLYYYDQAGNLVKTVPPEGVALLTDEQIDQVIAFKDLDISTCTETGVHDSEDHIATFTEFSNGLSSTTDKTKAIEVWLNSNSGDATRQIRIITPDKKYFYQAAIHDKKLWVEIYKLNPGNPDNNTEIVLSNAAVADLSAMPPLQIWTHLLVQSSTDLIDGQLELYLDGIRLTNLTGKLPVYPFEWEIATSGPGYTLPGQETGSLRHFRIYNRTALPGEVMANYQNPCLSPVGSLATGGNPRQFWGRFNVGLFCGIPGAIDTESIAEVPNDGSLEITSDPVAADNTITSVSNNFTVELWVKPTTTHEIDAQTISGYGGLLGQHYAIYPTWGQQYGTNVAGMGISVGTNGVSVYEHSGNYMPALLVWTGVVDDWTHVAVAYENKVPKLYINGQFVKAGLTSTRQHIYPSYNFGKSYGTWDFQGSLDEVRIWSNVRSAQQISDNYDKAVLPNEAGLAGYWPMSQRHNGTIKDISCNNLDFALAPGSQWQTNTSPVNDFSIVEYTGPFIVPDHLLATTYEYNSLNQVVKQSSPDGGMSEFWYDRLGRLAVSQNAKQRDSEENGSDDIVHSYTKYDELGRIIEVGERYDYTSSSVPGRMTEETARTPENLEIWYNSSRNRQVTHTFYDEAPDWAPPSLAGLQHNLRKRVTATAIVPLSDDILDRAAASYYSYDIMGNVAELVQENKELTSAESQYITGSTGLKHIKYKYDLVSGKVNKVLYQDGKWDQFYYQYLYDADNRLIKALSSRIDYADPNLWITEATYRYYLHGPLARMELGKNKVQGVDYAYTLQGWLKGVNGHELDPDKDMSRDGKPLTVFGETARDVYGFSLGYYHDDANGYKDYTPVGGAGANAFGLQYLPPTDNIAGASGKSMYNGNISHTTYAMSKLEIGSTIGYSYRYDQLNRLTATNRHNIGTGVSNWSNSGIIDAYKEQVSYDANGNIKTYLRNGDPGSSGLAMDDLTYQYERNSSGRLISNRLRYVGDEVRGNAYDADLKTQTTLSRTQIIADNSVAQSSDNYQYDKIGNLVKDNTEHIDKIDWTVYGKISSVVKNVPGGSNTTIGYSYDAGGNRIGKGVQVGEALTNTYYVRDAQGNVMGIYKKDAEKFSWQEQHLYGSSRIGMINPNFNIATGQPLGNETYTGTNDPLDNGITGIRNYELSNHLGNVLSVISDKKTGVDDGNGGIDHYIAEVLSQNDYYPGGMGMPGRKYSAGNLYRYGFNGKERDTDSPVQYDYGFRIYDARLVKFKSVDPLANSFPWNSPYSYAEGDVIRSIDLDGKEKQIYIYDFTVESVTKTKIDLPEAGQLGDGVLIKSNHGGQPTYYYGNAIPDPTIVSFKKAYEGIVTDKEGNHVGYKDSKGLPTIGYGHLIKKGESYTVGGTISESDAEALFKKDSKEIFKTADGKLKKFSLTENQKNALYDASFNMGPGKMSQYKEDGTKFSGENFFLQFMSGGEGIKKRRYAENLLYSEGLYIHFDVLKNKAIKEKAKSVVDEQIGGPSPVTGTENAAKIPDEKN